MSQQAKRRKAAGGAADRVRSSAASCVKKETARKSRPRKSPLSKPQLKELREILIQKRRALLGDMAGIEDQAIGKNRQDRGDLSHMPTHPADIGSDNYEQEFTLGLLESERALLEEINEALERMDNGTYGLCAATGKPIGMARLRARPWAKYCIDYAKLLEKGLVRTAEEEAQEGEEDGQQEIAEAEKEGELEEPSEPEEDE